MKMSRKSLIKLLIGIGMLFLICSCCPWDVPVLRILITLIVACAALMIPDEKEMEKRRINQGVSSFKSSDGRSCSHDCTFARSSFDWTDSGHLPEEVNINVAFGSAVVRLPVDANITLHATCAFGSVAFPEHPGVILGVSSCHLGTQDPNAPCLHIRANCAFGSLTFRMG